MECISREKNMKKYHEIEKIDFDKNNLILIADKQEYRIPLSKISSRLLKAASIERETYEISPSGYGIHWPLIDEDLSIDGILNIHHTPPKLPQEICI